MVPYTPPAPAAATATRKKRGAAAADGSPATFAPDRLLRRVRGQLVRLRRASSAIETLESEGWRAGERRVQQDAALKEARDDLLRSKLKIRDGLRLLSEPLGSRLPVDENGEVRPTFSPAAQPAPLLLRHRATGPCRMNTRGYCPLSLS